MYCYAESHFAQCRYAQCHGAIAYHSLSLTTDLGARIYTSLEV